MKQALLLSALFCLSVSVYPGVNSSPVSTVKASENIPTPTELFSELINLASIPVDIELKEADVPNLEARISHHKKYILYNVSFIEKINQLSGDKWCMLTLLAHETGHHVLG